VKLSAAYPYFTEIHDDVREIARRASERLAERAGEADETGDESIVKENLGFLSSLGLLGLDVPEEVGGQGLDVRSYALALEELSKGCASTAFSAGAHYLAVHSILSGGSEELKKKYLPRLASGWIGAFALTEPNAGSDAASISTRAEKRGGVYVLKGEKHFITNGSIADVFVVFAKTSPEKGARGITAFVVEKGSSGLVIGKKESKMGVRASPTTQVFFENVEVPEENVIGEEGGGFRVAMAALTKGRIGMAAQAIGISKLALKLAVQHAEKRVQFGQPVINFQAIQFMLAEALVLLRASEGLTYRAAWLADQKRDVTLEAATAKLFSTEAAKLIVDRALQVYGGLGYSRDHPVERLYRDVRILTIAEGTTEIQKLIVSRHLKSVIEEA